MPTSCAWASQQLLGRSLLSLSIVLFERGTRRSLSTRADKLGVDPSYVSRVATRKRKGPKIRRALLDEPQPDRVSTEHAQQILNRDVGANCQAMPATPLSLR